jgi:hypothetical protein
MFGKRRIESYDRMAFVRATSLRRFSVSSEGAEIACSSALLSRGQVKRALGDPSDESLFASLLPTPPSSSQDDRDSLADNSLDEGPPTRTLYPVLPVYQLT